jgi:hypothetical protein
MALVYAYRMADKTTNPYPATQVLRESQFRDPRFREKSNLERVAKALIPFNPASRAGKI